MHIRPRVLHPPPHLVDRPDALQPRHRHLEIHRRHLIPAATIPSGTILVHRRQQIPPFPEGVVPLASDAAVQRRPCHPHLEPVGGGVGHPHGQQMRPRHGLARRHEPRIVRHLVGEGQHAVQHVEAELAPARHEPRQPHRLVGPQLDHVEGRRVVVQEQPSALSAPEPPRSASGRQRPRAQPQLGHQLPHVQPSPARAPAGPHPVRGRDPVVQAETVVHGREHVPAVVHLEAVGALQQHGRAFDVGVDALQGQARSGDGVGDRAASDGDFRGGSYRVPGDFRCGSRRDASDFRCGGGRRTDHATHAQNHSEQDPGPTRPSPSTAPTRHTRNTALRTVDAIKPMSDRALRAFRYSMFMASFAGITCST